MMMPFKNRQKQPEEQYGEEQMMKLTKNRKGMLQNPTTNKSGF